MFKYTFLCTLLLCIFSWAQISAQKRVLVFSKTAGFRHASIEQGKQYFLGLGKKHSITIDTTEDATTFNEANLKRYNAVVFLSTTGDVLNKAQQADFERFIQAGGGYVGIHAASDTEYDWPWYNGLMGGYFASHPGNPNVQTGKMVTLDKNFPATAHLPETFERKDEFYDFKSLKTDILHFLTKVEESSYKDGKMGDFHPMSWYHEYDGGKAFYSNYGHTPETFSEPLMMEHFWGGLKWAMAEKLDYSKAHSLAPPEENRFERTILTSNLNEPTELATMPNGKVIFVERKGKVKVWNPKTEKVKEVGQIPVYTKFEYGLMGVGVDPNFEKNNWVYLYYTPDSSREATKDQFLSRFTYDDRKDTLLFETEKVVLRVNVKRVECCHTGGSIDWDGQGNLFLSTGDDTNPFDSDGYAPIDFRKDHEGWDALRSSGNTNDLRGKILRITPTPDGSYTIPEGNLFKKGTPNTRPEIFVMGCRNPYRIGVDKRTGFLYWGDVGPDAGKPDENRGPDGIVEFNQARKAGFFGWPIFTGQNFAYNQYDFEKKESGPKFNPDKPINNSPNNTGLKELPPAQKAWLWYGYGDSKEFPQFGKGGANPMGGPVYYSGDYKAHPRKFPEAYDGKFFAYEWMRDWIMLVDMDKAGNYIGMEPFMPNTKFYHPMDMAFSGDGRLFVLDYGLNWFAQNEEATLSIIEYNRGNRRPIVKAKLDKDNGAVPLRVAFSSEGTMDYDKDQLTYTWNFGPNMPVNHEANPTITFSKPGEYDVELTVNDPAGNKAKTTLKVKAGNTEPRVDVAVVGGNQSFFFPKKKIKYAAKASDIEDAVDGIDPNDIVLNISYLEGFDKTMLEQGHKQNTAFAAGKRLLDLSDCKGCHAPDKKSVGPAYQEIAKKYPRNTDNISLLSNKIILGGGGVWGAQAMAAHPQISVSDAKAMVEYILSINESTILPSLPFAGSYKPIEHIGKKSGAYIVQATYTDRGGQVIGPLSYTQSLALRNPIIDAVAYDDSKGIMKYEMPDGSGWVAVASEHESFIAFEDIDLKGIKTLRIGARSRAGITVGGTIEIHTGSPDGPLLGSMKVLGEKPPSKIKLKKQPSGMQKLYLVFKNPNNDGKPLMGVTTVEFLN